MSRYVTYRTHPEARGFCKTFLSHEATLELIEAVKKNEHLWNENDDCYDSYGYVLVSWDKIISQMFKNGCANADLAIDTWKNLYTAYFEDKQKPAYYDENDTEYFRKIMFIPGEEMPKETAFGVSWADFQELPSIRKHFLQKKLASESVATKPPSVIQKTPASAPESLPPASISNSTYPCYPKQSYPPQQLGPSQIYTEKRIKMEQQDRATALRKRLDELFFEKNQILGHSITGKAEKEQFNDFHKKTFKKMQKVFKKIYANEKRFIRRRYYIQEEEKVLLQIEKDVDEIAENVATLREMENKSNDILNKKPSLNFLAEAPSNLTDNTTHSNHPLTCETDKINDVHQKTRDLLTKRNNELSMRIDHLIREKKQIVDISTITDNEQKDIFLTFDDSLKTSLEDLQRIVLANSRDIQNKSKSLKELEDELSEMESWLERIGEYINMMKKMNENARLERLEGNMNEIVGFEPSNEVITTNLTMSATGVVTNATATHPLADVVPDSVANHSLDASVITSQQSSVAAKSEATNQKAKTKLTTTDNFKIHIIAMFITMFIYHCFIH